MDVSPNSWIPQARQYLEEVWIEFGKITWPSQKEYVGGTVGVLIIVTFMAIVLFAIDYSFGWGFNQLLELIND